jgi:hypothetical protein
VKTLPIYRAAALLQGQDAQARHDLDAAERKLRRRIEREVRPRDA